MQQISVAFLRLQPKLSMQLAMMFSKTANTVVKLAERIGIAGTDILPGAVGDLHVSGVFEFDKTSENAITLGTSVYFDGTGITEAANDGEGEPTAYTPAGFAAADAAAGDDKILVKIG